VKFDGRDYVNQAMENGAAAILLSGEDMELPVPRLIVPAGEIRAVMAGAAAAIYGRPADKLIMVGLTGTNGKTTTAYLMEEILRRAGLMPAVMGTINFRWPGHVIPAPNTTPEGPLLFSTLAAMAEAGAKSAVLEISSHALSLGRVTGLAFDAALFTNLSRDHLDFHGDMESYYQSKKLLFVKYLRPGDKKAVINIDDPWGARLAEELGPVALRFGFRDTAEVRGSELKLSRDGLSLTVTYQGESWIQTSPLLAEINGYNLLGASALALAMHIDKGAIRAALSASAGAPGRLEKVGASSDYLCLVDYAHSPDALDKALTGCRALNPRRLLAVFGCGGDRDKGKRPIMGRLAGEKADLAIITSDNPRTEDPEVILEEIEAGLADLHLAKYGAGELAAGDWRAAAYLTVADRRAAIKEAVRLMEPGDILLIAGKGHEDYQIIGREKRTLDDRAEALDALRSLGHG
jgi:UDP-N-acetylmuramoyl-L-alanyl-D-glutamate--2,6-diaminopimelate ligase